MWSDWLVFCDCSFQSVCPLMITGLWKLPGGRDWLRGYLGLVLMGGAMLIKLLTQLSVDGCSCVPSLLFIYLGPNYGGGNEDNCDPGKIPCMHCYIQFPQPCSRPPLTCASTRDSRTPTGKSRAVFCGITAPFFWVLVPKVLLWPPIVYFPVLCKFLAASCGCDCWWKQGPML